VCSGGCRSAAAVGPAAEETVIPSRHNPWMGIYDNSLRDLIAGQPHALADLVLGVDPANAGARYGPTELPGETMRTDTILEVDVPGAGVRRVQVEFQYTASATDIEPRLVHYWALLRRKYGSAPDQHVVVVNPRGGRLTGSFQSGRLTLSYTAHHLWEMPASDLLRLDGLYPVAVVGKTDDREQVFVDIVQRARGESRFHADRVLKNAVTFANLYLDAHTIKSLLRRTDMPLDLRELPMVQDALREGREVGVELGREQGREQGREEVSAARLRDLVEVTSEKFGPLPDALAQRMRDPSREFASVARAVMRAASVEELQTALG
jgi:predicted transposase YdaD